MCVCVCVCVESGPNQSIYLLQCVLLVTFKFDNNHTVNKVQLFIILICYLLPCLWTNSRVYLQLCGVKEHEDTTTVLCITRQEGIISVLCITGQEGTISVLCITGQEGTISVLCVTGQEGTIFVLCITGQEGIISVLPITGQECIIYVLCITGQEGIIIYVLPINYLARRHYLCASC